MKRAPCVLPETGSSCGAACETVLAVNIGSRKAHLREDGVLFAADTTGVGRRYADADAGIGGDDAALYSTTAWAEDGLDYAFAIEDGQYLVTLHFAEIWEGAFAEGARSFDIEIEGEVLETGFDIFAAGGAAAPVTRSFVVDVVDGVLDLSLLKGVQNPALAALEVARHAPAQPAPVDDALSLTFPDDFNSDTDEPVARYETTKWALFANDFDPARDEYGYSNLQFVLDVPPRHGPLQALGEASILWYVIDTENHPGADSFSYRVYGDDGTLSDPAWVTITIEGLPDPTPPAATLLLTDADGATPLFALRPHAALERDGVADRPLGLALDLAPDAPKIGSVRFTAGSESWIVNTASCGKPPAGGPFAPPPNGLVRVSAELFAGRDATGAVVDVIQSWIAVQSGAMRSPGYLSPGVAGFDEGRMGEDVMYGFEPFDRLAFFGDSGLGRDDILALAEVRGRDTVIDFGDGNVLTLAGYVGLTTDHIV